jgi:general secretion pathway protein I
MVAVSILGLALTVILSAQGGLAASNKSAANVGLATSLARCKMTELEEKMLKFGYPELDQVDTEASCCLESDVPGFLCDTRVEKVVLPNPPQNSLGDGGFMAGSLLEGGTPAIPSGIPSGLVNPAGGGQLDLDGGAGLQNIGNTLQTQLAGMGGTAGLLNVVMGFIYPTLKPMLETSIRRLTVSVKWKEGPNDREFAIVQYVTNPQRGGFINGMFVADAGPGASPVPSGAATSPAAPGGPVPAVPGVPGTPRPF